MPAENDVSAAHATDVPDTDCSKSFSTTIYFPYTIPILFTFQLFIVPIINKVFCPKLLYTYLVVEM